MRTAIRCMLVVLTLGVATSAASNDWLGFRGLEREGCSDSGAAPLSWSSSDNVAWRTAIPGRGHSSPIVSGTSVYVTTAYEDSRVPVAERLWKSAVFVLVLLLSLMGVYHAAGQIHNAGGLQGTISRLIWLIAFVHFLTGMTVVVLFGSRLLNPEADATRYWLMSVIVVMYCLLLSALVFSLRSRLQILIGTLSLAFTALAVFTLTRTGHLPPLNSLKGLIVRGMAMLPLAYGLALFTAHTLYRRHPVVPVRERRTDGSSASRHWLLILVALIGFMTALAPFFLLLYRAAGYQMPDSYVWKTRIKPEMSWFWLCVYGILMLITLVSLAFTGRRRIVSVLPLSKAILAVALGLATAFFIYIGYAQRPRGFIRAVVCLNRDTGEIQWTCEGLTGKARARGRTVTHASSTPVTDGQRVYAYFGADGLMCVDANGQLLWKRAEPMFAGKFGVGTSLVLKDNIIVLVSDVSQMTGLSSFVAAYDGISGEPLWKSARPSHKNYAAYSTPAIVSHRELSTVVVQGWHGITGYDLRTGNKVWSHTVAHEGMHLVASPVYSEGRIYIADARRISALDLTALENTQPRLTWSTPVSGEKSATPVVTDGLLLAVSESGRAVCLDTRTGEALWQKRLTGRYYSSVIALNDRILFTNEAGQTTVVAADRQFRQLAVNTLDGAVYATAAPNGNRLLLRTEGYLYCLTHSDTEGSPQ